jgi:hypothetical protein
MKYKRLLMTNLLWRVIHPAHISLISRLAAAVKIRLYNPDGKADQTTAVTQVGEESPGSTEQDAG